MKGKESRDAGWAAFNIDADGNQFDFTVALGGSTVGYRTPDSTHILLTKPTDTAICRISIQPPGQGSATNARRLEIICPWHGNDELDLATECVQQLSTALRLYKPIPFSIARWQKPRAGRAPRQNTERYSLKGADLRRFRDFSLRLRDFHVSRNLFRHARYLPDDLEDDVRELLGGSREHEARVLKAEPHIMIAADLFEKALEGPGIAPELRLVLLMMALESLFSTDDKSELAFRMSLRIAILNGSSDAHRKEMFEACPKRSLRFAEQARTWVMVPRQQGLRARLRDSAEGSTQCCTGVHSLLRSPQRAAEGAIDQRPGQSSLRSPGDRGVADQGEWVLGNRDF